MCVCVLNQEMVKLFYWVSHWEKELTTHPWNFSNGGIKQKVLFLPHLWSCVCTMGLWNGLTWTIESYASNLQKSKTCLSTIEGKRPNPHIPSFRQVVNTRKPVLAKQWYCTKERALDDLGYIAAFTPSVFEATTFDTMYVKLSPCISFFFTYSI